MKIDGACHCGRITYEADVEPEGSRICHCTDCQTMGGTAFRQVVPTRKDGFRLISGQPKLYIKVAESGNRRIQAFCADCGTHLYAANADDGPKIYNIRTGTVRQRDELAPRFHIWYRSARPWLATMDALPKHEKQQA